MASEIGLTKEAQLYLAVRR